MTSERIDQAEPIDECPTTVEEDAAAFQLTRQRAKNMGFAGINDALDALERLRGEVTVLPLVRTKAD